MNFIGQKHYNKTTKKIVKQPVKKKKKSDKKVKDKKYSFPKVKSRPLQKAQQQQPITINIFNTPNDLNNAVNRVNLPNQAGFTTPRPRPAPTTEDEYINIINRDEPRMDNINNESFQRFNNDPFRDDPDYRRPNQRYDGFEWEEEPPVVQAVPTNIQEQEETITDNVNYDPTTGRGEEIIVEGTQVPDDGEFVFVDENQQEEGDTAERIMTANEFFEQADKDVRPFDPTDLDVVRRSNESIKEGIETMTGIPYEKYIELREEEQRRLNASDYSDASEELKDSFDDSDDGFDISGYLGDDLLNNQKSDDDDNMNFDVDDNKGIMTLEELLNIPKKEDNTGIDEPKTEQDIMRESRLKRFVDQPIVDRMRISRGSKMVPPVGNSGIDMSSSYDDDPVIPQQQEKVYKSSSYSSSEWGMESPSSSYEREMEELNQAEERRDRIKLREVTGKSLSESLKQQIIDDEETLKQLKEEAQIEDQGF